MLDTQSSCDNTCWEGLMRGVQNANQTWKEAGVQFWIRAIESYVMPDFWDMTAWVTNQPWSLVKGELVGPGTPFPNAPSDAWDDTRNRTKREWLLAVAAVYAKQNEITVWLKKQGPADAYCRYPNEGRDCVWFVPSGNAYNPPHELGHYLGLAHTHNLNGHTDPSTGQPFKLSDRWDLVYKPGTSAANPNTYYNSSDAASADEASLQLIDTGSNCNRDNTGAVTCDIGTPSYSEPHQEGDNAMKGVAFPHPDGHGDNVMSYLLPRIGPRDLSDSQIAIVRKFLRWDEPIDLTWYGKIYDGFNYTVPVISGERPRLGSWRQRQPAAKLDFDGDGLRDIGVWIPPTTAGTKGEFKVLLSSHGYSLDPAQMIHVQLGELGDTPVPADYYDAPNEPPTTDVAVFQPGGGINRDNVTNTAGYWRWCPTADPPETTSCSSPTVIHYGERYDVPEPGLNFGTGDALAIYRPMNGTWYFKDPSWSGSRAVTMSTANSGAVPLAGQYDCDDEADLAVYEPMTAEFKLVRSTQNWDVSQMTTRQFSSTFIPDPYDEGGVIPIAGQRYERYCWNGYFFFIKPRLSAVLFFPENGTWYMNMDPVGSSTVNACTWGSGGVMPIGGLDWNADGQSDMLYYDANSYSGGGEFDFKATTWSDCSGNELYSAWGGIRRPRQQVFSVSDMDGDGINDLMIVDPDQGTVTWIKSSSGYDYYDSRTFGSSYMEVL